MSKRTDRERPRKPPRYMSLDELTAPLSPEVVAWLVETAKANRDAEVTRRG